MFKKKKTPGGATTEQQAQQPLSEQPDAASMTVDEQELIRHHGMEGLIRLGLAAASERKSKNRLLLVMTLAVLMMALAIAGLSLRTIEPLVLSETNDGRIRPLPLLSEPIYSQNEILAWADRCVRTIYGLSYIDWQTTISNDTYCLSDAGRKGFVDSLKKIGVLETLTPEKLGIVYAVPGKAVLRAQQVNAGRYAEWIVDVPYTMHVEGRSRGKIEAVMSMKIRRVPMTVREDGLWVDQYRVNAR